MSSGGEAAALSQCVAAPLPSTRPEQSQAAPNQEFRQAAVQQQLRRQLRFVQVQRRCGSTADCSSARKMEEYRRLVEGYLQLESHPVFYKSYGRLRQLSPPAANAAVQFPPSGTRLGSRRQVQPREGPLPFVGHSFGRNSSGNGTRATECLILEPSEMIVIDQTVDAFAAFAAACPQQRRLAPPHWRRSGSANSLELPLAFDQVEHSSLLHAAAKAPHSVAASEGAHFCRHRRCCELPATSEPAPLMQPSVLPQAASSAAQQMVQQRRRTLMRGNSTDLSYKRSSRTSDDDAASSLYSSSSQEPLPSSAASGFNDSILDSDDEDSSYASDSSLVPQDIVRDCLEKDPGDRSEMDIEILLEFMHNLPAFANLTMATRRAMCAVMVYAVVDKAGTMVMNDGEELDSWSAILNGKVEITYADGSTKMLHMGESFGIRPTREKEYHRGVMKTVVDDCQFVCIAQSDYYRILHQGQENTTVLRENGDVVMVTEKRVLDNGTRAGSIVIRGTPECLMRHLVEDHSPVDTTYVEDFLLTYRAFLSGPQEVARKLLHWFKTDVQLRARVTRVILLWVSTHFNDFESDAEMIDFLQAYEQLLESEGMLAQLRMLHMACTTKARSRTVTLTRAMRDEMLHFSIHGGSERASAIFVTQVERGSKAYEGGLKRGDQILQVNGHSFDGVSHSRALEILRGATHLSITVKSNLLAFNDMLSTPEGATYDPCSSTAKTHGAAGSPLLASTDADYSSSDVSQTSLLPLSVNGTPSGSNSSSGAAKRSKVGRGQTERISNKDRSAVMSTSASGVLSSDSPTSAVQSNKILMVLSRIISKSSAPSTVRVAGLHGSVSLDTPSSSGHQHSVDSAPLSSHHRSNSDPNLKLSMQRSNSSPDIWAGALGGAHGTDDGQGAASVSFPEHVVKIYAADQSFKYIHVHKETTAREVVMQALRDFGISEHSSNLQNITCNNYSLCEVSAEANGVVKQKRLPDSACNLAERIGVRSRYYLRNNMTQETLVPDDAVHDMLKESQFNFLSLSCFELAVQLSIADCALFQRIEPTEYVEDLCGVHSKFGTLQLEKFSELANKEMFWVVTEVCSELNVYKRVKILKHFINVARLCKEFRNFNSMFAILSGLGHGSVARLRSAWEKLPGKYQKMFEDLESIMDPTRNMAKYRSLLAAVASQPPVIPLFPIVKKDLAFIHYGNDTMVEGLVNFEKMRMIAKEVRLTCSLAPAQYTAGGMQGCVSGAVYHGFASTSSEANMSGFVTTRRKKRGAGGGSQLAQKVDPKKMFEEAQMTRRVKAYLAELEVEQDEDKLLEMSYKCEASRRNEMSSQSSSLSVGGNSGLSSPNPSVTSSAASAAKYGSVSPDGPRKLASLVESIRPLGGGGSTSAKLQRAAQQQQTASTVASLLPAAVHSPLPSPHMAHRMNGLSPSSSIGAGQFPSVHTVRPVDLSSESSSVISVGNMSRKSSITGGQCETPGERRRGATGTMPPPLSMASLAMALHDNDSGHCSFASSSYDAQSMSSAGSASSPPPPHRQTTPLLGQPSMYGQQGANLGGSRPSLLQTPHLSDVTAPLSAKGAAVAAAYASSRHLPSSISRHEHGRVAQPDCYGTDEDEEEVISAV